MGRRPTLPVIPERDEIPLGTRIRALRMFKRISLTKLAELAGDYDIGHLSHVETGRESPSPDLLEAICQALDTSPAQLKESSPETVKLWLQEGRKRIQKGDHLSPTTRHIHKVGEIRKQTEKAAHTDYGSQVRHDPADQFDPITKAFTVSITSSHGEGGAVDDDLPLAFAWLTDVPTLKILYPTGALCDLLGIPFKKLHNSSIIGDPLVSRLKQILTDYPYWAYSLLTLLGTIKDSILEPGSSAMRQLEQFSQDTRDNYPAYDARRSSFDDWTTGTRIELTIHEHDLLGPEEVASYLKLAAPAGYMGLHNSLIPSAFYMTWQPLNRIALRLARSILERSSRQSTTVSQRSAPALAPPPAQSTTVGEMIKAMRLHCKYSTTRFAWLIGDCDPYYLHQVEEGKSKPPQGLVARATAVFFRALGEVEIDDSTEQLIARVNEVFGTDIRITAADDMAGPEAQLTLAQLTFPGHSERPSATASPPGMTRQDLTLGQPYLEELLWILEMERSTVTTGKPSMIPPPTSVGDLLPQQVLGTLAEIRWVLQDRLHPTHASLSPAGGTSPGEREPGGYSSTDLPEEALHQLRTERRHEVAERIRRAKEFTNTVDNAEYDDAKNEQAFVEGRIQSLERLLATAVVIDGHAAPSGYVRLGSQVTLGDQDDGTEDVFTIVDPAEADPKAGKVSSESPIGRALLGHTVGDNIVVPSPGGNFNFMVKAVSSSSTKNLDLLDGANG